MKSIIPVLVNFLVFISKSSKTLEREYIYYSFPFYYCINPKSEKNIVADKGLFFSTNIIRNV